MIHSFNEKEDGIKRTVDVIQISGTYIKEDDYTTKKNFSMTNIDTNYKKIDLPYKYIKDKSNGKIYKITGKDKEISENGIKYKANNIKNKTELIFFDVYDILYRDANTDWNWKSKYTFLDNNNNEVNIKHIAHSYINY